MILHDWQRGKIPFFVPPPKQKEDEASEETNIPFNTEADGAVDTNRASAALRAIAGVIASQQQKSVPVQRDLFTEEELKGEELKSNAEEGVYSDDDKSEDDEEDSADNDEEDDNDEEGDTEAATPGPIKS